MLKGEEARMGGGEGIWKNLHFGAYPDEDEGVDLQVGL